MVDPELATVGHGFCQSLIVSARWDLVQFSCDLVQFSVECCYLLEMKVEFLGDQALLSS